VEDVLAAAPGAITRDQVAADPTFATMAPEALGAWRGLDAEVVVPLRFGEGRRGLLRSEDLSWGGLLFAYYDGSLTGPRPSPLHRGCRSHARETRGNEA
jgi:hypothetical protein